MSPGGPGCELERLKNDRHFLVGYSYLATSGLMKKSKKKHKTQKKCGKMSIFLPIFLSK